MVAHCILDRPLGLRLLLAVPLSVACLVLASACGGGGSSSPAPAVTAPDLTAPSITASPSPVAITTGGTATFTVAASGSALTYQWQVSTDNGTTYTPLTDTAPYSGSATATLTVNPATITMTNYLYDCVVSGTVAPPATSVAAKLTVTVAAVSPNITTQPAAASATDGGTASFNVVATGTALAYKWQASTDNGTTYTPLTDTAPYSGSATATLTVNPAKITMTNYLYKCVVSGTVAPPVTSAAAKLTVIVAAVSPNIATQPAAANATVGGTASFNVVATGTDLIYKWQVSTDNGTTYTPLTDTVPYSGSATATLTVNPATITMTNYLYECVVSGTVAPPVTSAAAKLTVTVATAPPNITTQPAAAGATDGGSASFNVVATGTALTYKWQVSTDNGTTYTPLTDTAPYSGSATATLTVNPATITMTNYLYECVVSGTVAPPVTSDAAKLTVTATAVPANITTQPGAASATVGGTASFNVVATGTALTYHWQVSTDNGTTYTPLTDTAPYSGSATATLTVNPVTIAMTNYMYECVVIANVGPAAPMVPALLTVVAPATITSFTITPASLPAAGGTVTLTAVFTGASASVDTSVGPVTSGIATSSQNVTNSQTFTLTVLNSLNTPVAATARVVVGAVGLVAGTVAGYGEVDKPLTASGVAKFSFPAGLVYDASTLNLVVVDQGDGSSLGDVIRVADPVHNTVTTLAGTAGVPAWADGTGAAGLFNSPYAIAADGFGNYFVADTNNHVIRLITAGGAVSTIAGTPSSSGYSGITGSVPLGKFSFPYGVAVNLNNTGNGHVYVADQGNYLIRDITLNGYQMTALTDIAGTPHVAGSSDDAPTTFNYPIGICLSGTDLYVADGDISGSGFGNRIRRLSLTDNSLHTLNSTDLLDPLDVVVGPGGFVYVADNGHSAIKKIDPATGVASTVADASNGLINPTHVAADASFVYVSDSGNNVIRKITGPSGGTPGVTTLFGGPVSNRATFSNPSNVAVHAGTLYVADRGNSVIRAIDISSKTVSPFAGQAHSTGTTDGALGVALFYHPQGVATDSTGNVFVADTDNSLVRMIVSGYVQTIPTTTFVSVPSAICVGANGDLYVASVGRANIVQLHPQDPTALLTTTWTVSVLAGPTDGSGKQGNLDGPAATALFNVPGGLAFRNGTVYVADSGNNNIRAISGGNVTTLAGPAANGNVGAAGALDGFGTVARFDNPMALALDATAGYLFVTDTNNGAVRRINLNFTPCFVDTLVGVMSRTLDTLVGDLPTAAVSQGVAVDNAGNLYFSAYDAVLTAPY